MNVCSEKLVSKLYYIMFQIYMYIYIRQFFFLEDFQSEITRNCFSVKKVNIYFILHVLLTLSFILCTILPVKKETTFKVYYLSLLYFRSI